MARSLIFPGADQSKRYDRRYRGPTQGSISKLVLHSTETSAKWGCPGYGGGAAAPTMTICPWTKRRWQHFPATMSARALLNPRGTSVSENRDNVAQIEIIGYSDAKIAATYGYSTRDFGDDEYEFIAETVAWFITEHDVPNRHPSSWPTYPSSYGNTHARMSSGQYDRYTGWLAHLHVSGNSHGDITLDPARLKRHIDAALKGGAYQPEPPGDPKEWKAKQLALHGKMSPATVKRLQAELGVTIDGELGTGTMRAAQKWLGVTVDGIWGEQTISALQRKVGSSVDGELGYWTIKALQRWLNDNRTTPSEEEEDDMNLSDRLPLDDADRTRLGGSRLESISVGALLKYGAFAHFSALDDDDKAELLKALEEDEGAS